MSLTPEQAAAQSVAQDPSGSTPAAEPVAQPAPVQPAPAGQGGPWINDLAQRFPDEATRSQVDAFLRDTVQPHVTQLEQDSAQATALYNDLVEKPNDTYLELAEELYGPDAKDAIAKFITAEEADPESAETVQAQAELPPEVQVLITERQERIEKAAFDAEFARVQSAHPDVLFEPDLFIPVVAETGDFEDAVIEYQAKYGTYLEWAKANAAATPPVPPTAPQTLGTGDAAGAGEVATSPKDQTLHEAIDDYFAQENASGRSGAPAPPVVPA